MSWEDGGHKVTLGSWECHVCGDLVFLSLDVCRKRLFLLIKIIELCVNDQRIHKVCRFDHCQMFTSKLSYFEGFLYDDNPKAWQEIGQPVGWGALPLSIFYDLQIETKVSLSLRNFVVALSVCVCVFFPPHRSYTSPFCSVRFPLRTSAGTGTRSRENRHTQDTNNISITDWILVQGNLGKNRLGTWEDVGVHSLGLPAIESFRLV